MSPLALAILLAAARATEREAAAIEYLTKFGYIETKIGTLPVPEIITSNEAVKK